MFGTINVTGADYAEYLGKINRKGVLPGSVGLVMAIINGRVFILDRAPK